MIRAGVLVEPNFGPERAPAGRYEFRAWPRDPLPAVALLQSRWPLDYAEARADIYLATARSPWTLVKLRGGTRLEIKRRGKGVGVLQHWTCPVSTGFPLPRAASDALADALGLVARLPPEAGLSPAHLLAALAGAAPAIMPATVRKARLTFRRGSCRTEICRVGFLGRAWLSLAVEDPDPVTALAAVQALGLDDFANRSYGDMLCPRLLPTAGPRRGPRNR